MIRFLQQFELGKAQLQTLIGAKCRRPVVPGDKLMREVTLVRHKRNIGWVNAEAKVDDQLVCSAELMFSIASDPRLFGFDATVLHAQTARTWPGYASPSPARRSGSAC